MLSCFNIKRNSPAAWADIFLAAMIFFLSLMYVKISGNRHFDFDEFEVLYAGASLLRGKALYADQIEPHFPAFNICMTYLIRLFGFKTTTLLAARYFVLLTDFVALMFTYKIAKLAWNKRSGLLAVCLTLASIVFVRKGIEIRHDVFNMTFNVLGAYYALRYLRQRNVVHVILSGILLGLALASTQKALVWNVGIIVGIFLYSLRSDPYKEALKMAVCYSLSLLLPLVIIFLVLMIRYHESANAFLRFAVLDQLNFYSPETKELYPFPYNRYELFKDLIYQNHLLYALALGGMFSVVFGWLRSNTDRILVATWALAGVLFYVTAKRPFFQSFLPSVVPLSILAAGLLSDVIGKLDSLPVHGKIGTGLATIFLLLLWPVCLVVGQVYKDPIMLNQVANVSFCLKNLEKDDKVLCFSQNQIFFDPVFKILWGKDGKPIYVYDPDFFERRMIDTQCRVIVNDYRTKLLNRGVTENIRNNYLPMGQGDILIAGFKIEPGTLIEKRIWIEGNYYTPSPSVVVDGEKIKNHSIRLEQKKYRFQNLSDVPVSLLLTFDNQ